MRGLLGIILFSVGAHAQYEPNVERGLFTHKFRSPGGVTEECVISQRFPNWSYNEKKNNKAIKDEAELCGMDFYDKGPEVMGVCPKLNSTNPGILMFDLDGEDKASFEAAQCHRGKEADGKVLAKYKASVSCSYTPSIVSYYQISQMFGGLLKVPEATLRTIDFQTHKEVREDAIDMLKALGLENKLIGKTWRDSWQLAYQNPEGHRGRRVFTKDGQQIYGALMTNPRGEEKYREIYGSWNDYDKRFEAMTALEPYKRVTSSRDLGRIVGSTVSQESVQGLVQMRDVADMLVLDYILGQTDRPGNIHYYDMLFYSNDGVNWDKIKMKKADKEGPHQTAKFQLPIKEMILKDNDCGVSKGNMAKEHGLLDNLKHLSPATYKNVLRFAEAWEKDEQQVNAYVEREWLFTSADISAVRGDLLQLRDKLQSSCRSGQLQLDLDLSRHFSGQGPDRSCELQ